MAITCPQCGKGFDVTLFQFGHRVRCDCGAWVDLDRGHRVEVEAEDREDTAADESKTGRTALPPETQSL